MKLYAVRYKTSDWEKDTREVQVVTSSTTRASEFVSKRKYTSYSGYVVSVIEVVPTVVIAK
jgi:hypothetical protein